VNNAIARVAGLLGDRRRRRRDRRLENDARPRGLPHGDGDHGRCSRAAA
jgi:hypothetical protein